jgi:methionyl-tRNA synthetase
MKQNSFYITTTLPYVNAPLHMGHALEFVRADAIARYKKLQGYEVFFNTGTDEHGLKIFEKAKENNLTPQEFVDNGFLNFKKQLNMFGVSEDINFVRTTDEHHIKSAQEFWRKVSNNGYIYKKNYESKYCVGCESEKTDSELVDGFCPDHPGKDLVIISEENYFFKYSAFTEKLLKFYEENPNFVVPDFRYNEIKAFVSRGLQDFSISRLKEKMPWGIPVPGDENHVMYVWFDALTNYISTLGWPEDTEKFEKFWSNGNPTQYCGKDNLRFQSAMWQAMLMAADLPNSHQIIINGFITADGGVKMSKTLGNVVDPKDIVAEYGTDALRFFLLSEVSSFEDSPFTMERFKESYNAKLANGLGNLTSRIMKMVISYDVQYDLFTEKGMQEKFDIYYRKDMNVFNLKKVIDEIWVKISILDKKINEEKPFILFKTNPEEAKKIIATTLIMFLDEVAFFLKPFLPETSDKIRTIIRERKMPTEPLFLRKD